MFRHSTILGRNSLSALLYLGESGRSIHAQHATDAVSHLAASACSVLHSRWAIAEFGGNMPVAGHDTLCCF